MKLNQYKSVKVITNNQNKNYRVSEDPGVVQASRVSLDLKVTRDNPAHQARRENEVYPEQKESEDLLDNRVFLVSMAKME